MNTEINGFMPASSLLLNLHHKFTGVQMLRDLGDISIPHTRVVEQKSEIVLDNETILKPVYSQFERNVVRGVSSDSVEKLDVSPARPWVQQQKFRRIT